MPAVPAYSAPVAGRLCWPGPLKSLQVDTGFRLSHPSAAVLQIQIRTDDMELAAELVQDIAAFLGVLEMDCLADFPAEMEEFGRVLDKVCPSAAVSAGCEVRDRVQRLSLQFRLHLQRPAQCCLSQLRSAAALSTDTACHAKRQRAKPFLQVQEHNATRIKMTAEMADSSNVVKALVVKLSLAA